MKIGVLIATYNGEKYLQEQLNSIINQSKRVDEIIVSDDGSTDNTVRIINQYISHHEDIAIRLVINKGKHGVTSNFENAFRHSTADLLFFSDQDDVWKNNKVSSFLAAIEKFPQFGLYFSNATLTNGDLVPIDKSVWDVYYSDRDIHSEYCILEGEHIVQRLSANNFVTGMSMAAKREMLERVFPLCPALFHDEMFACYCAVNGGMMAINAETAYYRQHGGNAIGVDGSMYVSDDKRRNSIFGLINYSDQNLPIINHLFYKSKYFLKYDSKHQYDLLSEQYAFLKQIHHAAKSNKIMGFLILLNQFIKGKYHRYDIHKSTKFFILDLAMVLFVSTNKRKRYFSENE